MQLANSQIFNTTRVDFVYFTGSLWRFFYGILLDNLLIADDSYCVYVMVLH